MKVTVAAVTLIRADLRHSNKALTSRELRQKIRTGYEMGKGLHYSLEQGELPQRSLSAPLSQPSVKRIGGRERAVSQTEPDSLNIPEYNNSRSILFWRHAVLLCSHLTFSARNH